MNLSNDMDIAFMATQQVPAIQRQQHTPLYVVPLPSYKSAQEARRKGLRSWLRYQRRSFYVTVVFVFFIFLMEIAGLTFALAVDGSLPGQAKLFPQTFPLSTPAQVQCIHETVYIANGQVTQTGIDEVCH